MPIIQNLVARLTMDSTAFDRNSKRSANSMRGLQQQSLALQRTVVGLAGSYLGARGLIRAMTNLRRAAMKQEEAEIDLRAAVGGNIDALKTYAAELQKRTRYGDEAILAEIAYGRNLGITTDRLQEAAKAAVGLAAKYKLDLHSAMMLIGRASQGQTQMLTRYGIVLDDTLSIAERFDALLRIGADSFHLAEAATKSLAGRAEQLGNRWGDLKERLGVPIAEAGISSLERFADALDQIKKNSDAVFQGGTRSVYERFNALTETQRQTVLHRYRERVGGTPWNQTPGWTPQGPKMFISGPRGASGVFIEREIAKAEERQRRHEAGLTTTRLAAEREAAGMIPTTWKMQGAASGTPIDYDAAYKSLMDSYKDKSENTATDIAAAWRAMAGQMDRTSTESFEARYRLLNQEYLKYDAVMKDKIALQQWYLQQVRNIREEEALAGDDFFAGFAARVSQLNRELESLGGLGARVAETGINQVASGFADAWMEGRKLSDVVRNLGRDLARMGMDWGTKQIFGSLLSSVLSAGVSGAGGAGGAVEGPAPMTGGQSPVVDTWAPVFAKGGTVRRGQGPRMALPSWAFSGAPHFARGGEVPIVAHGGERVQTAQEVADSRNSGQRMVGLLEQLVSQGPANVVIVQSEQQILDALGSRAGRQRIMEVVAEGQ